VYDSLPFGIQFEVPPLEYQKSNASDTFDSRYLPMTPYDKVKFLKRDILALRGYSQGLEKKNLVLETQYNVLR
jgi:hypothetical protein